MLLPNTVILLQHWILINSHKLFLFLLNLLVYLFLTVLFKAIHQTFNKAHFINNSSKFHQPTHKATLSQLSIHQSTLLQNLIKLQILATIIYQQYKRLQLTQLQSLAIWIFTKSLFLKLMNSSKDQDKCFLNDLKIDFLFILYFLLIFLFYKIAYVNTKIIQIAFIKFANINF